MKVPTSVIKLRYDDTRSRSCREDEARFEDGEDGESPGVLQYAPRNNLVVYKRSESHPMLLAGLPARLTPSRPLFLLSTNDETG